MKRRPTNDILSVHELMRTNIEVLAPVLARRCEDALKAGGSKVRLQQSRPLTNLEEYCLDVFTHFMALVNTAERLEWCRAMLARFPAPKSFSKSGIGPVTWMEYHLGYFVVLYVSTYDCGLLLTNAIFRLGNAEKLCKSEVISGNRHVKKTGVPKALAGLDRVVKPYRQQRHAYVHRGQPPAFSGFTGSDLMDFLKAAETLSMLRRPVAESEREVLFRGQPKLVMQRVSEDLAGLGDALLALFDSLMPTYTCQLAALRSMDTT